MKSSWKWLFVGLLALSLTSCGLSGDLAAKVGNTEITNAELAELVQATCQIQDGADLGAAQRAQALSTLVQLTAIEQFGKTRKVVADPAIVTKKVNEFSNQFPDGTPAERAVVLKLIERQVASEQLIAAAGAKFLKNRPRLAKKYAKTPNAATEVGKQLFGQWAQTAVVGKLQIDPRYGKDLGSLSKAVSAGATLDPKNTTGLPKALLC